MYIGTATMGIGMEVPQKTKNRTTIWSSDSTFGYLSNEKENTNLRSDMHLHIHWSMTYNSQDMETTSAPDKWINKEDAAHARTHTHTHTQRNIQFSSVAQSCPTLCNPMNRSTPGLPVHHQLPEFTQTHIHQVSNAIQPSHPLLSPSPPAPNPSQHQSLFQWVNSSHEVAKALEFQLYYHSFQRNPRADLLQNGLVGSPCSPRDSQPEKWINKEDAARTHAHTHTHTHTHRGILLSHKKNEILTLEQTQIELEGIMPSEISQTKTNTIWFHL